MKEQAESVGLIVGSVLYMYNLSGRKARNRALLIVVGHAAVGYVAAVSLLQEQGVNAVIVRHLLRKCLLVGLLQVYHCHERMLRLKAHRLVVFVDGVEFYQVFHAQIVYSFLLNFSRLQRRGAYAVLPAARRC